MNNARVCKTKCSKYQYMGRTKTKATTFFDKIKFQKCFDDYVKHIFGNQRKFHSSKNVTDAQNLLSDNELYGAR